MPLKGRFSMVKMAAQVTAAGIAGVLALKVVGFLVFPIIGLVFGVLGLLFKIALVMAVGYFVLELLKRVRGDEEVAEDVEIEVEVEDIEEREDED
jgi:hypothetical protein